MNFSPLEKDLSILILLEYTFQQAKPCMMVSQADEAFANLTIPSNSGKPKKVSGSGEVLTINRALFIGKTRAPSGDLQNNSLYDSTKIGNALNNSTRDLARPITASAKARGL